LFSKFRFVPAADPAAPWAEAFAEKEGNPDEQPKTNGQEGEKEVEAIPEADVNEHGILPALGTVCCEAEALAPKCLCVFRSSLGRIHASGGILSINSVRVKYTHGEAVGGAKGIKSDGGR